MRNEATGVCRCGRGNRQPRQEAFRNANHLAISVDKQVVDPPHRIEARECIPRTVVGQRDLGVAESIVSDVGSFGLVGTDLGFVIEDGTEVTFDAMPGSFGLGGVPVALAGAASLDAGGYLETGTDLTFGPGVGLVSGSFSPGKRR